MVKCRYSLVKSSSSRGMGCCILHLHLVWIQTWPFCQNTQEYEGRSENILTFRSFSKPVKCLSKEKLFVFKIFPTHVYTLWPSLWELLYSLCKPWSRHIAEVPIYRLNESHPGLIFVFSRPLFQFWKYISRRGKDRAEWRTGKQLQLERSGFYCRWGNMGGGIVMLGWKATFRAFWGGRVWRRCRVSYFTGASNWYWLTVGQGLLSL